MAPAKRANIFFFLPSPLLRLQCTVPRVGRQTAKYRYVQVNQLPKIKFGPSQTSAPPDYLAALTPRGGAHPVGTFEGTVPNAAEVSADLHFWLINQRNRSLRVLI